MADAKNKLNDALGQAASAAKDTITDAAQSVSDRSQQLANSASAGISSAASYVNQRANDAAQGAASGLKSAGEAVQRWSPQAGPLATATRSVGQGISGTGDYLKQSGMKGVEDDLIEMIKRYPLPALVVGICMGYLLAHVSRSKS